MIPYMNYELIKSEKYLYYRGESTKQFYYILRGNISIREKLKKEKQEQTKSSENIPNNLIKITEATRLASLLDKNKPNNYDDNKNYKFSSFRNKNQVVDDEYNSNTNNDNYAKQATPIKRAIKKTFLVNKKDVSKAKI